MKLKIAYSISCLLSATSAILLYLFFAYAADGNVERSNLSFFVGFGAICISFILLPTKPVAYANAKTFRVRYYRFLTK